MTVAKKRSRRTFSKEKVQVKKFVQIELSKEDNERFEQESNAGEFISDLIEEHYDENVIKIEIDPRIREAYKNDPYNEFRAKMLLIDFYTNKNSSEGINYVASDKTNNIHHIERFENPASPAEEKNNEVYENNSTLNESENLNNINEEEIKGSIENKQDYINEENNNSSTEIEEVNDNTINDEEEEIIDDSKVEEIENKEETKEADKNKHEAEINKSKFNSNVTGTLDQLIPKNNRSLI
ncbi:hypothetical protein [uncultured Clostridium sp.]|uniref:hypothetical protein n=1 Tax=uncultured Clostridium sp. TaxID=59620 RepID=UPI0028EEB76F|nr:hypothetical protein [uncultured Clostridium sp.]